MLFCKTFTLLFLIFFVLKSYCAILKLNKLNNINKNIFLNQINNNNLSEINLQPNNTHEYTSTEYLEKQNKINSKEDNAKLAQNEINKKNIELYYKQTLETDNININSTTNQSSFIQTKSKHFNFF